MMTQEKQRKMEIVEITEDWMHPTNKQIDDIFRVVHKLFTNGEKIFDGNILDDLKDLLAGTAPIIPEDKRLCMMLDSLLRNPELKSSDILILKYTALKEMFFDEIKQSDYSRIRELFEEGEINGEQLADMVIKPRDVPTSIFLKVYDDLTALLNDKILSNPMLGKKFISLYKEKYYKGYKKAQEIIKRKKPINEMYTLSGGEYFFCKYILLNTDDILNRIFSDRNMVRRLKLEADSISSLYLDDYSSEIEAIENFSFSGTEESIFFSKQFENFLLQRRNEIAEFLGVKEKEMSAAIVDGMDFSDSGCDKNLIYAAVTFEAEEIVMLNNGQSHWLEDAARSKPNVDRIIENYYITQVNLMYENCMDKKGSFTELDLLQGWVPNPEKDIREICHMCCMDSFYNMFLLMMQNYYLVFFKEKIIYENIQQQHNQKVDELNLVIEDREKQISELDKKLSLSLSREKDRSKDKDKESRERERKLKKLSKEIEQRDEEIDRLKDYIQSQNEFIEMQNQQEPDEAPDVDIKHLQRKKYLFVGKADEQVRKLRRCFPNSIFMQSENKNISDISVDAIVFLPQGMPHSMYHKVKNSSIYKKVPSVVCYTRNIDRICYDMSSRLKFD